MSPTTPTTGTADQADTNGATRVPGELGPASLAATEIAARVRSRELDPVDVVRAHAERIERYQPALNAFASVTLESAVREAEALRGRDDLASLPLAGVPVAIKDNVDVQGLPTRFGSYAMPATPAAQDDERSPVCAAPAPWFSARRRCPSWPSGRSRKAPAASRPATRGRPGARRGARAAAARSRWRPGWPPWRSAPTAGDHCGFPRRPAGSSASSRRPAWCRCPGAPPSTGAGAAPSAHWRGRFPTPRSCSTCSPAPSASAIRRCPAATHDLGVLPASGPGRTGGQGGQGRTGGRRLGTGPCRAQNRDGLTAEPAHTAGVHPLLAGRHRGGRRTRR